MNTLALADLVLDYADAAGIVVHRLNTFTMIDYNPSHTGSGHFIYRRIAIDDAIAVKEDLFNFTVTLYGGQATYTSYDPGPAIKYALTTLASERARDVGSKSGRRQSIKREGLWLAKNLIAAAQVRLDVVYTEEGFWFERVLVKHDGYGAWSVYVNISDSGTADKWEIDTERTTLRIAFSIAIELTMVQRMEEFER